MAAGKSTAPKGKSTAADKNNAGKGKSVVKRDEEQEKKSTGLVQMEQYDVGDVGTGFEDMDASFFTMPFVRLLQKTSKEVDEDSDQYVEGAKAGMAFKTDDGMLIDTKNDAMFFIPVHTKRSFIEWVPIEDGGGFVAEYMPTDPVVRACQAAGKFGKMQTEEGNDLVETFTCYGLITNEDRSDFQHAVISFTSTNIKTFKGWMSKARAIMGRDGSGRPFTMPLFAHVYRLATEYIQNDKGSWYKWTVKFDGQNAAEARLEQDDELFQEAKNFRVALSSGQAKENYNTQQREGGAGRSEDGDVF